MPNKADMKPCPGCGAKVVLPETSDEDARRGVGLEAHLCADPDEIAAFFDAMDRHRAECGPDCDGSCIAPVTRDGIVVAEALVAVEDGGPK